MKKFTKAISAALIFLSLGTTVSAAGKKVTTPPKTTTSKTTTSKTTTSKAITTKPVTTNTNRAAELKAAELKAAKLKEAAEKAAIDRAATEKALEKARAQARANAAAKAEAERLAKEAAEKAEAERLAREAAEKAEAEARAEAERIAREEAEARAEAERLARERAEFEKDFVKIPNKNFSVMKIEVTQKLYESVMGENPSRKKGENLPVACVSWCDAIYFCNKLSEKYGYTPVYSVNGSTSVSSWNYKPHSKFDENVYYGDDIKSKVTQNEYADGFRLLTLDEWEYTIKGGEDYIYSGSNNIDEVCWYKENSGNMAHPVAQKKANGYGLYDMSGNICECCWDSWDKTSSNNTAPAWGGGGFTYSSEACMCRNYSSSPMGGILQR